MRVVPTSELSNRLRDSGADAVRIRGGFVPASPREGRRRGPRAVAVPLALWVAVQMQKRGLL